MRRLFTLTLCLALCVAAPGCGDSGDKPDGPGPGPGATPATPAAPNGDGPAAMNGGGDSAPLAPFSAVGLVEELGPSIYMEGSHKLTRDGALVCLLESKTVDLAAWVGKPARVEGNARPTTEGNQTIVAVTAISAAP